MFYGYGNKVQLKNRENSAVSQEKFYISEDLRKCCNKYINKENIQILDTLRFYYHSDQYSFPDFGKKNC